MNQPNIKERRSRSVEKKRSACERGFTLMETAIALVVMMIIGLAVSSLFVYAIKFNSGANDRALSLNIAQQRMERLRKTPFSDAVFSAASTTETVVNADRSYTVVTTIAGSSTLKTVTVQVTALGATGAWSSTPVTVTTLRATPVIGAYFE
jgi:Tfp pilus assembly protein PilV